MKGLDIVRRDWSVLSKDIGNYCLEQILRGDLSKEEVVEAIHSELRKVRIGGSMVAEETILKVVT
jgi:DNA polymerase alpha subunit A